ncbi:MAG: hypothetical protein RLY21_1933 [Planctomycetota bacterium]|jgi:hypothetical protein
MSQFDLNRDDTFVGREQSDRGLLQPSEPDLHESGDLTIGGPRRRRRMGTGPLLFVVVGIAAFGSLWSMRAIGRASAATGESSEAGRLVESYLSEQSKSRGQPSARELSAAPLPVGNAEELQVPRERLMRDPFAAPWRAAVVADPHGGGALASAGADASGASDAESRITAWDALVDEGAHDFVVESVLIAPDPRHSIVSMNGGVFRVGESVMFPDRPIRYEIRSVEPTSITLVAFNAELSRERLVRLVIRELH